MAINENRPIGGLNLDDDVRSIPLGDYSYALNFRTAVNDAARMSAATNIRGDVEITSYNCPYNVGDPTNLPAGYNLCIGAEEETEYNTVVFFNWNSNGNHGIYRYWRNRTNPNNIYGVVEQVMQFAFPFERDQRITSIEFYYLTNEDGVQETLCYFCCPKPYKVNLDKANIATKAKSETFIFTLGTDNQAFFFQFVVRDYYTNAAITSININLPGGQTREEMLASVATQINAGLSAYAIAEACDCSLTVTENGINKYIFLSTLPQFFGMTKNWYGTGGVLIDRMFDRCKWQPMQAPQVEYGQDTTYQFNYVKDKVFQFRLQYHYDDKEGYDLAPGVISQIPINNIGCDGKANESYNYIDVDFNDPALFNPHVLTILKSVEVWAREHNEGVWYRIIDLKPCEFVEFDSVNNVYFCHSVLLNKSVSDPSQNTVVSAIVSLFI